MIEAYRIGVELVLGGDLAAGIEALIPGLVRLDGSLAHANAEAKGLAAGLDNVARTATGIGQAADAMERLNAAMASMNRAAEHWRTAGALPAVAAEPGVASTKAPGNRTKARAPDAADAALPASNAGKGVEASAKESGPPAPVSNAGALVQAIQVTAPDAPPSRMVEAAKAPGAPPRIKTPAPATSVARTPLPAYVQDALAVKQDSAAPSPMATLLDRVGAGAAPTPVQPPEVAPKLEQAMTALAGPSPIPDAGWPARETKAPGKAAPRTQRAFAYVRDDLLPQIDPMPRPERRTDDAPAPVSRRRHDSPASPSVMAAQFPAVVATQAAPTLNPAVVEPPRRAKAWDAGWAAFQDSLAKPAQRPVTKVLGAVSDGKPSRSAVDAMPAWLQRETKGAAFGGPMGHAASPTAPDAIRPPANNEPFRMQPYHTQGDQAGPVIQHVTYLQLDERTIARAVTRQQLRMMGGQVSGTLRPDPSLAPQYGAHLLES